MILPRISIRTVFVGVAGVAVLLGIVVSAISGNRLAISLGVGLLSLLVTFMVFALLHLVTLLLAVSVWRRESRGQSPFAQSRQPPQLLRPDDPE